MKEWESPNNNKPDVLPLNSGNNGSSYMMKNIPKGIFAVSFFGLFLGMSTTMIYSQIGMFLKMEMHVTEATIALVEGIVEFISFMCRILSGIISDYLNERKFILLFGCVATLIARSMLVMASSSFMIVIIQSIERLGNGFQATTRDALIASISSVEDRGKSYGFSRSLKTIGSLLGAPIAIFIMYLSNDNYKIVFFCAVIPVIISIICLFKIQIPKGLTTPKEIQTRKIENPFRRKYLKSLNMEFVKIILLAFIFEMGHFTESLLPLYINNFLSQTISGSCSIFVSLGQVLLSFPIGFYSDKFGKNTLIKVCIIMMISANISFIFANSAFLCYLGAFLWGGQMTAIQGLFLSIISQKVDKHILATAIGIYCFAIGLAYLMSSIIAGQIWTNFGGKYAFAYSLCVSCFSLCASKLLLPRNNRSYKSYE